MSANTPLTVAAIALDIVKGEPEKNLENAVAAIDGVFQAGYVPDIVVLPELFTTSFISNPEKVSALAEPLSGETLRQIEKIAARFNIAIAGSILGRAAHKIFNRGFFVEPSGETTIYDKRHLFRLSPEAELLSPGIFEKPVVRYRGWNIGLVICYDLRFPVWCRNRDCEYDMLIVPANWPSARDYAWRHLLIARAIENQAVVVGCNRSGEDKFGKYDNETFIFDALGQPIGNSIPQLPNVVIAKLSRDHIDNVRCNMPAALSADYFSVSL